MAEPMDPEVRKRLLLGAVLVAGLGYLGYDYVYVPRSQEVAVLEQHLDELRSRNATARALSQQQARSEVEQRLQRYREQLDRVEGLVPSTEEVPDLLDAVAAQAQRTGVELSLIQPVGATAESYYTRQTYDMAVLGPYHNVGAFLTRVGSLPRIVAPTNVNLTVQPADTLAGPGAEPKLQAKFSIETYVLPSPVNPPADTSHAK